MVEVSKSMDRPAAAAAVRRKIRLSARDAVDAGTTNAPAAKPGARNARQVRRRKAAAGNQLKAAWHQEWEVGMQQMIEDELLLKGNKTPKEVVIAMKDSWEKLRSRYARQ